MNGPRRIKIEGDANLIRDMHSKAIINPNAKALSEYQRLSQEVKQRKQQADDINNLKNRIDNIENLLQQVLAKLG